MKTSQTGLDLIKKSEGFRASTYLDVAGFPTIGYGHKLTHPNQFPNGISETEASVILSTDVASAEGAVSHLVRVALTQGQFDALVDFVFNLGAGRLQGSTLLRDLNAGQYAPAAEQILAWDHGVVNGRETELSALKARRLAEHTLWNS